MARDCDDRREHHGDEHRGRVGGYRRERRQREKEKERQKEQINHRFRRMGNFFTALFAAGGAIGGAAPIVNKFPAVDGAGPDV